MPEAWPSRLHSSLWGSVKGLHPSKKNLHVVTILAKDRVGIIRDVADVAAKNKVNVERSSVTARGDLISIEFLMDFGGLQ